MLGIRQYREADCERLLEVWAAASAIAHPFVSDEFHAEERNDIRYIYLPMAETWVYETEGRAVGFIAPLGHEVGGFFVHPDYQGRGIGRALMDHAVKLRGDVFLDVFSKNSIGRNFYARYGFEQSVRHMHEATGLAQIRLVYPPNLMNGQPD